MRIHFLLHKINKFKESDDPYDRLIKLKMIFDDMFKMRLSQIDIECTFLDKLVIKSSHYQNLINYIFKYIGSDIILSLIRYHSKIRITKDKIYIYGN